ncbi:hypothetical protein BT67DRAFT_126063 [Trichocladium antarcticum]|uniref:Uncharacterized protein n=1 Tax=Trichocladium antarcticum TaxID=1450529 RepID=A0AAN6ZHQ4_9PEZI|nr:hypothetical protein BT67DRAFT_126063 [Trichocladium antarcticum]
MHAWFYQTCRRVGKRKCASFPAPAGRGTRTMRCPSQRRSSSASPQSAHRPLTERLCDSPCRGQASGRARPRQSDNRPQADNPAFVCASVVKVTQRLLTRSHAAGRGPRAAAAPSTNPKTDARVLPPGPRRSPRCAAPAPIKYICMYVPGQSCWRCSGARLADVGGFAGRRSPVFHLPSR